MENVRREHQPPQQRGTQGRRLARRPREVPIHLDALIGSDDEFGGKGGALFSSSEDLTTSDSEICRYSGRNAARK